MERTAAGIAVSLIIKKYSSLIHKSKVQIEVEKYADFLIYDRGLAKDTVSNHKRELNNFLQFYFVDNEVEVCKLIPMNIKEYIDKLPNNKQSVKRRVCATLKSYFRFLELRGISVKNLAVAIPVVSSSRAALSPKIINLDYLDLLLNSINRSTATGRRNFVAILCMSDLGIRIGDVARLSLDDINWRAGLMRVANNKTKKPYQLPIPKRLGDALVEYVTNGRPESKFRNIFLRHLRPIGVPATECSLRIAINREWKRAGLSDRFSGTHILRHSVQQHA